MTGLARSNAAEGRIVMPVERNPGSTVAERERVAVEGALGGLDAEPRRTDLLPLLRDIQARLGWLPRGALQHLADRMNLPFPDVWGVATFYALFRLDPPHGTVVHVCDDVPCRLRGGDALLESLEARYGPPRRFTGTAHGSAEGAQGSPVDWEVVPCLGQCDHAPVAVVAGRLHRQATIEGISAETVGDVNG
jgi:NADH-quinone oxidoreductase subunit F